MKTATIREAQHHLTRLMKEVEAGQEIVLTRRGKGVGKLIPLVEGTEIREYDRNMWLEDLAVLRKLSGGDPQGENLVVAMRREENANGSRP